MTDKRIIKLAQTIVSYSTKVKKGDWVHIWGTTLALPLMAEIQRAVLMAGGNPTMEISDDLADRIFMEEANDDQINWTDPLSMLSIRQANVLIFIDAPTNTHNMAGIPADRLQMRAIARKEWHDVYISRSANGDLRWNMTVYPCPALAQDADMCLSDYEDFVFKATFTDQDDPIQCWQQVYDEQQRMVEWMKGKKKIQIIGKHANLELSITGREFINSTATHNMPSGEVFTSPVEDSANGWVEFTYPAIIMGQEVEGIHLEFKDGMVVKATARKNEDFLQKMLASDEGASKLGELGIGTNYGIQRFTSSILFDEKIGGTFHLAVGSGFEEAGGVNKSAIHWDMICDAREETTMAAVGDVFYRDGKFTIPE